MIKMNPVEIFGLIASALIITSMAFKTTNYKGTMLMRAINLIGSTAFIIYGLYLPAYSTALTNACGFILNIIYLFKEYKDHKKLNKK